MKAATVFALLAGACALGLSARLRADPLKVGDPAPAVTGTTQTGAPLDLGALYKHHPYTLVYFFPRAFTSGCTKQGCSIRDSWAQLQDRGVAVVGVSTDSPDRQAKFKAAEHFPFPLIGDPDHKVIDAFGVPVRSVGPIGSYAKRVAFLIQDGKIVWVDWGDTTNQAANVLKFIEGSAS